MTMTKSQPTALTTLKGHRVTVCGIGVIDGFVQLALDQPEGNTMFLYQMKCDTDLVEYLKKTWDCIDHLFINKRNT